MYNESVDESMSEQKDNSRDEDVQRIKAHIPPDLDYLYRDVVNVFVGAGDVILEFGNIHRSMPGTATISNRIVLSVANAYELQNNLTQALAQAQQKLQQELQK